MSTEEIKANGTMKEFHHEQDDGLHETTACLVVLIEWSRSSCCLTENRECIIKRMQVLAYARLKIQTREKAEPRAILGD